MEGRISNKKFQRELFILAKFFYNQGTQYRITNLSCSDGLRLTSQSMAALIQKSNVYVLSHIMRQNVASLNKLLFAKLRILFSSNKTEGSRKGSFFKQESKNTSCKCGIKTNSNHLHCSCPNSFFIVTAFLVSFNSASIFFRKINTVFQRVKGGPPS